MLDPELLDRFPVGYRHLGYLQTKAGFTVKAGLPGLTGGVVERLYDDGAKSARCPSPHDLTDGREPHEPGSHPTVKEGDTSIYFDAAVVCAAFVSLCALHELSSDSTSALMRQVRGSVISIW
jgi:hypothetical protein